MEHGRGEASEGTIYRAPTKARAGATGSEFGGAEKVGEEAVAGGFDAGIVFHERNTHHIEIEANGGTGAFEAGHGIGHEQKLRADAAFDTVATTLGAADEFVAHPGRAHGTYFFFAEFADAGALDLFDAQRHSH